MVEITSIAGEKCDGLAFEVKCGPETEKHKHRTNNNKIPGEVPPQYV
jgi:hypothetical protein